MSIISGESSLVRIVRSALIMAVLLALPATSYANFPSTVAAQSWATNGEVRSLEVSGNTMYLGGKFSYVGPRTGAMANLSAAGIATVAFPYINIGTVRTLVEDGSGGWFVGGTFKQVDGLYRQHLIHVEADGTLDSAWEPEVDGSVYALKKVGSKLYVGGTFTHVGGAERNNLAAVDVDDASVESFNPDINNKVVAIDSDGTSLFVAGTFTTASTQPRAGAAAFALNTELLTVWNPDANEVIRTLIVDGSTVYLGGAFTHIGGADRNALAAVDPTNGTATSFNPNVEYGTGLNQVKIVGNTVWFCGSFSAVGGAQHYALAGVDKTTAVPLAFDVPRTSEIYSFEVSNGHVYAPTFGWNGVTTEYRMTSMNAATGAIDEFDLPLDTEWMSGSPVYAIDADENGDLIVAGGFASIGGVHRANLAAVDVTTGLPTSWNPGASDQVNSLDLSDGLVYIAGKFANAGGESRLRLAAIDAFDGTASGWNPGADAEVNTLLVSNDNTVFVGGSFLNAGGQARSRVASLDTTTGDATSWDPNASGPVYAIAPTDDAVYLGGAFSTVGGESRVAAAAVDPTTASVLAFDAELEAHLYGGYGNQVKTIAVDAANNRVFLAGSFGYSHGEERDAIAAVDDESGIPTSWHTNISGMALIEKVILTPSHVYAIGLYMSFMVDSSLIADMSPTTGDAYTWPRNASGHFYTAQLIGSTMYTGGSLTRWVTTQLQNIAIFQIPPQILVSPEIAGIFALDQILTCSNGTWDETATGYARVWLRDGQVIPGATAQQYTLVQDDLNARIECRVTATGTGGQQDATSEDVIAPEPPSALSAPTISGMPNPTNLISCTAGTWHHSDYEMFVWLRDGVELGDAIVPRLLEVSDVGHTFACKMTAHNDFGETSQTTQVLTVVSNTPPPQPQPPANVIRPKITGKAKLGRRLTCQPGTWTNTPTFTYVWRRAGKRIASGRVHRVVRRDLKRALVCVVTAKNSDGSANAVSVRVKPRA